MTVSRARPLLARVASPKPVRSATGSTATGFDGYVTARGADLLRTAFLLTGDHQRAEDLVQTALAKVQDLESGMGLNAATGEYEDLVKAGVIDPVKVTRSALRNAASIASMVLTTDTLVVEKKEEEPAGAGGQGHGHGH